MNRVDFAKSFEFTQNTDINTSLKIGETELASVDSSLSNREWLNTEQAADYLAISVGALRNMTSNGQVPYYKLGNRNRYSVTQLRQLLLSRKRGASNGN